MTSIGTHSGAFQADEALGVWLLRRLPQYKSASLTRSRDPDVLKPLTIVIDVAGLYDHDQLRYDHHQRGFFETFDGENKAARDGGRPDVTGPDSATGVFKTKLSASGLVYKHYGREILCALHPTLRSSPDALEWVYTKMYRDFMEGLDANDNGIEIADQVRYKDGTSLPMRVARLNSRWNEPAGSGPTETERFEQASALCGSEFGAALEYIVECELPARSLVEEALQARHSVHPCGEVLCLSSGGCPWKTHLYELERSLGVEPLVKFVLYPDTAGMWRVQAVTVEGTAFTNRLGLLEPWRGVRDAELAAKCGIPGAKFVHASGFIGGHETNEGALQMALKTIESS
ncbi:hypothetical protein EMIHUDRAFT_418635, partial [Emiliania huxleyi CCMP1516]|uniref:Uncharacterized protein n=2 Tax=Emiliania huxleyi TaxID=2903 RepID=A0A0D3JV93_EMIH1